MMQPVVFLATVVLALAANTASAQADWDIVLNGRAIHLNAEQQWNEDNWGLGLEREFNTEGRWIRVALANGFKDSVGEPSYMAGGGVKRRFRVVSDNFYVDIGVVGFLMTREDVNGNKPFPGALPALTIGGKRIALNITYMPDAVVDRITHANLQDPKMEGVLFLQLKLDASLLGFGNRRQMLAIADNSSSKQ